MNERQSLWYGFYLDACEMGADEDTAIRHADRMLAREYRHD